MPGCAASHMNESSHDMIESSLGTCTPSTAATLSPASAITSLS